MIVLPMFIYQLYQFLKTALTAREQKMFKRFIPLVFVLFVVGFFYGIAYMYCLSGNGQIKHFHWPGEYVGCQQVLFQMIITSTLLGLLFEAPVVLTILIRLRVVSVSYLIKKQRYAIVGIFVFVSLLPPTDALSITLMSLPLVLLYYMTIFINRGYRPEIINQLTSNKEKIYV